MDGWQGYIEYWLIARVAAHVGCSTSHIRKLVHLGELPCSGRIDPKGDMLFTQEDIAAIERYLEQNPVRQGRPSGEAWHGRAHTRGKQTPNDNSQDRSESTP